MLGWRFSLFMRRDCPKRPSPRAAFFNIFQNYPRYRLGEILPRDRVPAFQFYFHRNQPRQTTCFAVISRHVSRERPPAPRMSTTILSHSREKKNGIKPAIAVSFLSNARRLQTVVRIIQENTNTNYITHSEVIEHRAEHTRRWAHFRHSLLADDIKCAIRRLKKREGGVLVATRGRSILGVAVLLFNKRQHYGVIEDIVVSERYRGCGIGHKLIAAAMHTMTDAKLENVILESGIRNESAHGFFRSHGFKTAAVMFLKRLGDSD